MKASLKVNISIIWFIGVWISLLSSFDWALAKDPEYPVRPISYYIGMSAGGSTDLASRGLIAAANKHLSQPIIAINKAGGGGTIAIMEVLLSKPDGYTIGLATGAQAIFAPLSGMAPYKDISGFTWIARFGRNVYPLLVRGDAPWKTWNDLISAARKKARGIKVGTTAAKAVDSKGFTLWQVEKRENVEFTYVPFKGSSEILAALLGGHVGLYLSTSDASTLSFVQEGKIRILMYLSADKLPGYEHIPSVKEVYGTFPEGYELPAFLSVWGPKGASALCSKKIRRCLF